MFYGQFVDEGDNPVDKPNPHNRKWIENMLFISPYRISFTIPEIILLSSTKQNIQVFKHLKSSFRKIKRLLQSYEMNIKLSILEMYFSFVFIYLLLLINFIAPFHIAYPPK